MEMSGPSQNLRILIIGDDPLARAALAMLLNDQAGCTVVGQVVGDENLPGELNIYRPEVVLWDLGWEPGHAASGDRQADGDALLPRLKLEGLTERESAILKLVGLGMTNRAIGEELHLSEKTIKHYVTNILEKLHVHSRLEAVASAMRNGLLRPAGR